MKRRVKRRAAWRVKRRAAWRMEAAREVARSAAHEIRALRTAAFKTDKVFTFKVC